MRVVVRLPSEYPVEFFGDSAKRHWQVHGLNVNYLYSNWRQHLEIRPTGRCWCGGFLTLTLCPVTFTGMRIGSCQINPSSSGAFVYDKGIKGSTGTATPVRVRPFQGRGKLLQHARSVFIDAKREEVCQTRLGRSSVSGRENEDSYL